MSASSARTRQRPEILVVEDDLDLATVMQAVLAHAGYDADTAVDGVEALEKVAAHLPSLILLDMRLPRMDGAQFAKTFHHRYGSGVPIVVVTAAEHARAKAAEVAAAAVLSKPFELDALLRIVEAHVPPNGTSAISE